ncbi:MAG: ATP-binding protein [Gemmatimonadota bacterium]
MKLAQRLTLTMVAITVLLVAPAIYGLSALRELRQVAYNLSTRDAVGALALGRLQTAFQELDTAQRIYLAFAAQPSERSASNERVTDAMAAVDAELDRLREGGYESATSAAEEAWQDLQVAIAEEQRLIDEGAIEAADVHRETVVDPTFQSMNRALDPIGEAINLAGEIQVQQAQAIAARAATTTLLALAFALLIALLIGTWTARNLLRPVSELRRGMAAVAEGDFEQKLHISANRPDEIGDLARSFSLMADDLVALDRMKAEFVSVASHELKTPLSVIRGYVSLLRDEVYGTVTDEQKKVLGSVGDQTDRLGRLIQQLLDVSRFEAGVGRLEIKPFNFRAFLDEFALSFEALAAQGDIDFEVVLEPDLPETTEGDSDRLNEVVGNLLANAFKFTPRQGRVELRAERAGEDGDGIRIHVSDNGVGIPAEQLPRVFEKFYQVENSAQPRSSGTGLGLAISKEIVEAHGGTITADSAVGKGTTFHVFLPPTPSTSTAAD